MSQSFTKCHPGKQISYKNQAGQVKILICAGLKDGVPEWLYTDGRELLLILYTLLDILILSIAVYVIQVCLSLFLTSVFSTSTSHQLYHKNPLKSFAYILYSKCSYIYLGELVVR